MVLVGGVSGWDMCWSGFTIKALKSSMPRFWSGRYMKELLYPFISCSLNILLVENYKDGFWVAQSNRFQHLAKPFFFFSLLEGPPISALLHPCRLARVMTRLVPVLSCSFSCPGWEPDVKWKAHCASLTFPPFYINWWLVCLSQAFVINYGLPT